MANKHFKEARKISAPAENDCIATRYSTWGHVLLRMYGRVNKTRAKLFLLSPAVGSFYETYFEIWIRTIFIIKTLVRWIDRRIVSLTKCLIFYALLFFVICCKILCKNPVNLFFHHPTTLKRNNTWLIKWSTQQPSILYWRLLDFCRGFVHNDFEPGYSFTECRVK